MKMHFLNTVLLAMASLSMATLLASDAAAQPVAPDTVAPGTVAAAAVASGAGGPQLGRGASDILRLEQAKVGDDTILAFIRNSGTGYALTADQIIYLEQQGVSTAVINAMLNQPRSGALVVPATAAPQPVATTAAVADTDATYYNPYYYDSYPYYYNADYGYYPWPYPVLSFGWGGYWGGWRGWHGWNGWHGGGVWHGGGAVVGGWHGGAVGHVSPGGGWHGSVGGGFHGGGHGGRR